MTRIGFVGIVLACLCSVVRADATRYWAELNLASIEGVDDLLLFEEDLPLVTTKASIILTDGEIEMRFSPPEIATFGVSDSEADVDMTFAGSNVEEFQSIDLPSRSGNTWGPGTSNVELPLPRIELTGEFQGESFAVEFDPSDLQLSVEEVGIFDGNLVAQFREQSRINDRGLRLQDFVSANPHETAFPDSELVVNYWFELGEGFREVNFDYSNIMFQETEVGDANSDGNVDLTDFFILSFNFGTVGDTTWEVGDFDENGIIEFKDFLMLAYNYQSSSAVSAAAVPEPDSFRLTSLLLLSWLLLRRKSNV